MTGSGRMAIPIRCTYRKTVVIAKSTVVEFGGVLYGEDKEMCIELVNDGALETLLKIKDAYGRSLKDKTEGYSTFSRQMSMVSESR
jgi:hypothetical protein